MSEVEAAFQRAKLAMIKKEIETNECGVVYPPDFNFWYAEDIYNATTCARYHMLGFWLPNKNRKRVKKIDTTRS